MHIIGPSHVAVIENVIQKMVDQIFIWCMHMYGKNEKKERLWDPFSFLKGSSGCLMLCHLQYSFRKYYASWKGHEPYMLYPHVPTPWHVFALWEFLVTLPPSFVQSLFPEDVFVFLFEGICFGIQFPPVPELRGMQVSAELQFTSPLNHPM